MRRSDKPRASPKRAKRTARATAARRKPKARRRSAAGRAVARAAAEIRKRIGRGARRAWRGIKRLSRRASKRIVPRRAARRRAWRGFRRLPLGAQAGGCALIVVALWVPANWLYQVARKPSELLFPVSGALYKTPAQTWDAYARLFRRHSTDVMTPELLAALAQVEGSGNPVVRTYWRFRMSTAPFEIYRPASSAVGMYQITDGTFDEARRYCIHDHRVVEDGPWHDLRSCWLNALYTRIVPSHAIEMTSAYLDRRVAETLARSGIDAATLGQKQTLAAVVHLCGRGAGLRFARQGLAPAPGQRCGSHDLAAYLRKVERMKTVFARLAAGRQ